MMIRQIRIAVLATALMLTGMVVHAQDEHPAQQLVVTAVSDILDVYENEADRLKSEPDYLDAKINELIVPYLDFESMTKLAVSKFWRRADQNQRAQLVEEFTKLLKNTYTNALAEYNGDGGEVSFEPFRPERREDRAVVRSTFSQSGGKPIPVVYKLRDRNGWSIYDIEANDFSLVTGYRSAFSSEIEKGGIDGLINSIRERNGS